MPSELRFSVLCAALTLGASVAFADCQRAGQDDAIAEGRITQRADALILKLPQEICLEGEDEFDSVDDTSEIHVFSSDDGVQATLRGLIGKDVQLRGTLMGAHTQHHKAPIIMDVSEADEI